MKSKFASISISPIQTSDVTSSTSDANSSSRASSTHSSDRSRHLTNNDTYKTPLQQQQPKFENPSPPNHVLRKDQFTLFQQHRYSFNNQQQCDDNDENNNDHSRLFLNQIDAPSDELDHDNVEEGCHSDSETSDKGTNHETSDSASEDTLDDIINDSDVQDDEDGETNETEEDRKRREEEESEALARQLMAEEAMASYAQSSNYLREHANDYSEEDLRALEALMAEEDPMNEEVDDLDDEDDDDSQELSYESLLRLGERIGDVKSERWALKGESIKSINYLFTEIHRSKCLLTNYFK